LQISKRRKKTNDEFIEPLVSDVNEEHCIPSSFDGTARLFPLPNAVLFPRVTLPLHIFEPRYRQMTSDALTGDHLIAMVLLRAGWEEQYDQKPAIHEIGCLGKIVGDQQLEDGRYNLLLRGLSRARVIHEVDCGKLYRSGRVELLYDIDMATPAASAKLLKTMARLAGRWFSGLGIDFKQVSKLFKGDVALGTVGDILTFVLPIPAQTKQELLEQVNVEWRIRRLVEYLEGTPPPKSESTSILKFPPEFSPN
jgi:Lon protease-like protein